jgi:hypothetical protein
MAQAPQKTVGGGGSLYYEIANFQTGMDLRKSPLTAPAGSLQMLQNAHITPGGEIEKREAFVFWANAPAGSLGMCAINNLAYTHLVGGTPGAITAPTDTAVGVIHIGAPKAFIQVTGIISSASDQTVAGTTFNVTSVSPATPLPVGTLLSGTAVTAGTTITSNAGVASDGTGSYIVNNSQLSFPSGAEGAAVSGVTLQYQLDFDTFDGLIYAVFQGSDGQNYHYYNGIQVTQATGKGYNIRTYKEKMYGVNGRNLFYSAVGDPTIWLDPSPDSDGNLEKNHSGSTNLGAQDADSENMISMEVYYDKMALFSTLSCQLWFLDPDESKNQYYQTLRDAGTIAPASVRQYVASDVYFLGNHGVRSLRARDLTLTAAVADVGSPLDPVIQDLLAIRGAVWGAWQTQAILSPRTGRIWMTFGDRIYILSNFASPNISAWSVYLTDDFFLDIQGVVFADPYLYLRGTNGKIYRYGSTGAQIYDACPVEILTPYLSFDKPVSYKFYQGFDAICTVDPATPTAQWNVEMSFDPVAQPPPFDQICTMDSPTVLDGRIPISGRATHVQLRIKHQAQGPATFAKLFIHYAPGETS